MTLARIRVVSVMGAVALAVTLAATLCARTASGQRRESEQPRLLLKPVAIFAQHLFEGDLRQPRGIAVDPSTGEVWVADTAHDVLAVFTPEGVPVFTTARSERLRAPARVRVDGRGRLLVLDSDRSAVRLLSYRGEYLGELELRGLPKEPVIGAIALDADGNFYLGENSTGQVFVFDPELKPKLRFGSHGDGEGLLMAIGGIAADRELIVVVDHRSNPAVQVFDRRGNFRRGWGRHDMGVQNISLPEAVALDSKGHVIVVDALRHEIKFFTRDGDFITRFGGLGSDAGNVAYPSDVAVDAKDRVYVVEKGNSRVQVFEQVSR